MSTPAVPGAESAARDVITELYRNPTAPFVVYQHHLGGGGEIDEVERLVMEYAEGHGLTIDCKRLSHAHHGAGASFSVASGEQQKQGRSTF